MKQKLQVRYATVALLLMATVALAADVFPVFKTTSIEVIIPTNIQGLLPDAGVERRGTNIIYHLKGQIFTNSSEGHIQFKSEGFSGSSDRSTPWKAITELFSVYQDGTPEARLRALYSDSAKEILDKIFTNATAVSNFQNFGSTFSNAQALMWHGDTSGKGLIAYVKIAYTNGHASVLPFYLVQNGRNYELAPKTVPQNSTNNITANLIVFFNSEYATNLIH